MRRRIIYKTKANIDAENVKMLKQMKIYLEVEWEVMSKTVN